MGADTEATEIARLVALCDAKDAEIERLRALAAVEANSPVALFQRGTFTLHSGATSDWKIECDALTDEDWATLAVMALPLVGPFGYVEGIPRGGLKFAEALKPHTTAGCLTELLVDDVLTTGASFEEAWKRSKDSAYDIRGVVAFARGECPAWVTPVLRVEQEQTPR